MILNIDTTNRLSFERNPPVWEWNSFMELFSELNKFKDLDELNILFTDNLKKLPNELQKKRPIVFIVSDEEYTVPEYIMDVTCVFKHYVKPEQENLNIFPIPQFYNRDLIMFPPKNILDREIDVSFVGNPHTSRSKILFEIFNKLKESKLKVFFDKSSTPLFYSKILSDSKISLCLDGQITPESFRFWESMMFGNVILASDKMPKNWLYNKNFYTKVDWKDFNSVVNTIKDLISDKEYLQKTSLNNLELWNNTFSPKAIAIKYCYPKIKSYIK